MSRRTFRRTTLAALLAGINLVSAAQAARKIAVLHSAEGFPGNKILDLVNRNPFIKASEGFEVHESYSVNPNVVLGVKRGTVSISFSEKFSERPLGQIIFLTNDFSFLAQKPLLGEVTAHFHFPDIYTDTVAVSWSNQNGALVGRVADPRRKTDTLFLLNPKGKSFFRPVTQEEYIHFLLALLQDRLDQKKKHLNDRITNGAPPGIDPANAKAMALVARNLRTDSLWINYYQGRMNEYNAMLKSMSADEKGARAYAISPKVTATESDKRGNLKEEISGGFPFELLRSREDAASIMPLYQYNQAFFDPHLQPAAVQLIAFRGIKASDPSKEFDTRLQQQFFPTINFKSFAELMYK